MRFIQRSIWRMMGVILLSIVLLGDAGLTLKASELSGEAAPLPAGPAQGSNLLANGGLEPPFYWQSPNHYIAHGWNRWWIHGTVLPEFDSSRTGRPFMEGESSQVYFKWGVNYTAGVYQVVENVMPCMPYRLSAWARNESLSGVIPRARVGIDPHGTRLTSGPSEGAVLTLPAATVWSGCTFNSTISPPTST